MLLLAGATTASEVREGLTFAGPLPHGGAALGLKAVEAGKVPDIEFASGNGEGSVVVRYYVPVAALGAGIDTLTSDQLERIWRGEITDWGEAVGYPAGSPPGGRLCE